MIPRYPWFYYDGLCVQYYGAQTGVISLKLKIGMLTIKKYVAIIYVIFALVTVFVFLYEKFAF